MSHFLPQTESLRHSHDAADKLTATLEIREAHILHTGGIGIVSRVGPHDMTHSQKSEG